MKTRFERGDKTRLAELAGTTPQRVCDYLSGRLKPPVDLAIKLAAAARMLGFDNCRTIDWIFPSLSRCEAIKTYYLEVRS